ncbi:UNVERIFIED_CONTAM: hypothetical protein Sindi_1319900, partial [Sesamum indicum]
EPVTRHLPANSRIIGCAFEVIGLFIPFHAHMIKVPAVLILGISRNSRKLVDTLDYVNAAREDVHLVFVVGISTSEEINQQQLDDTISGTL